MCAGIIAGGNNEKCGMGVAFGAKISSKSDYMYTIAPLFDT